MLRVSVVFRASVCLVLIWPALAPTGICRAREDHGESPYARTLLEQINNYRTINGLPTLRFDTRLNRLAMAHSFTMFRQKRVSHCDFAERFRRSGSRLCVENVGGDFSTPLKQFDAWRHTSGFDENMLNDGLHAAGIAEMGGYVTFFACR